MRKGQISGQVFIYILAAVVVGIVLLFGIQAVLKLLETGQEVELVQFKVDFKERLRKHTQHGVVDDKPIEVPGDFEEVCFIQLKDEEGNPISPPFSWNDDRPIIYNSWEDQVEQNIFFISEGEPTEFMYFEGLRVNDPDDPKDFVCESLRHGKITTLRFRGQGDAVVVERA